MAPKSDLAVEAEGIVKSFSSVRAVDGVDLAVPAGGVFAFLGPNGISGGLLAVFGPLTMYLYRHKT